MEELKKIVISAIGDTIKHEDVEFLKVLRDILQILLNYEKNL